MKKKKMKKENGERLFVSSCKRNIQRSILSNSGAPVTRSRSSRRVLIAVSAMLDFTRRV